MADNQMVKIVFDFDLGNVPASAKKLSQYLKDNSLDLKFTKASVDGLSASLGQLSTQQTKAGNAAAAAGNQIKKSNMQWTNFALVLQDLPYGFRGIQNNLPALMGGFAGLTGPIYLAGSALIAFFTAWDNGMIKFGNTVKLATDFSKEAATAYSNETIQLESLYRVTTDANVSMDERLIAAQALKKEYPGLLGLYSDEDIALGKADKSYQDLTKTIWEYAQVKAAEKTLEELAIKQNDLTVKKNKALATQKEREINLFKEVKSLTLDQMTFTQRFVKMIDDLPKGPLMMVRAYESLDRGKQNLIGLEEEQKSLNDETKIFKNIIDENITSIQKLNGYTQDTKKTSAGRLDDPNIKLLQAKQKYYKDDLLMSASFEQEILGKQRDLAVKQAELEKKNGAYIQTIRDTYNQLILNSQAETGRRIIEEQHKLGVEENKEHEKIAKEAQKIADKAAQIQIDNRLDIAHAILAINKQFAEDDLRNAILFAKNQTNIIETELAVQDKLNRNSLTERIEYTKQALAKLAVLAAYTFDPKVLAVYLDSFDKVNAKLKGMGTNWEATSLKIKGLIEGVMSDSISQFAENIGKSFNGEDVDIFGGITEVIATGLQNIGKALIAYGTAMDAFKLAFTNPFAAIAAGVVLVASGVALQGSIKKMNDGGAKTKKFANGGIISGPTMGLMGEYPGARTNPEVVAPLDKLKDMIGGGGGGTFMLRGQDLLLSVNRAQKASNLKGQNISLA
jgi:hypothetical protein